MTPQYSDYYRNKQLMRAWKIEKAKWLAIQSFILFTMMTALLLSTGLQERI